MIYNLPQILSEVKEIDSELIYIAKGGYKIPMTVKEAVKKVKLDRKWQSRK